MILKRRFIVRVGICAGVAMLGSAALSLWNKSDFCRGWSAHYAEREATLRTEQAMAVIENRTDDAATIARSADSMSLIASKYERVASNPFLAYPSRPLVTDSELAAMHFQSDR